MKANNIFLTIIIALLITGCTPAKIVKLPKVSKEDSSQILVYRESAFNAGAVGMVFGFNNNDIVVLSNKNYSIMNVVSGEYETFVRSTSADQPFVFPLKTEEKKTSCLRAFANPNNIAKALVAPIAYHFSNTFLLEEVECPDQEFLNDYIRKGVQYSES